MKRQIVCSVCGTRQVTEYRREWFKRVPGNAKRDMICDLCSCAIHTGDACHAESMGVYGSGHPYYEWEGEYIHDSQR